MPTQLFTNIWNVDKKPRVRHEELDGRQYLVVPMSMILEGVHAGSQGPIYYSKSELSKTPKMWNMKPITVAHPKRGDTATDLGIYKSQAIGMIMSAKWQDGKLKAEAWIDKKKAKRIEPTVLEHIESGIPMEVSTGLFADCILEEGTWKGEKYVASAQNIRADHLAILPDKDGACSISDGAGLLVNQATEPVANASTLRIPKEGVQNMASTMSQNEVRRKIEEALQRFEKKAWISDVFPDFIIYSVYTEGTGSQSFKRDYSISEEGAVEVGELVETVEIQTKYVLRDGTLLNVSEEEPDENVDNSRTVGAANDPATQRRREMLLQIRSKITEVTKKIYELMDKMKDRKLTKEQHQRMATTLREMQGQLKKHKQSYLDGMRLVDESDKHNPVRKSGVDSNLQKLATMLRQSGVNDLEGFVKKIAQL